MQKSKTKTRFAPSPTGLMHFGNARTALFNYLVAKQQGGIFLLRVEDSDTVRSETHFLEALLKDLAWFGLEYQEGPVLQSERGTIYAEYYQKLLDQNVAYPCFCSEETLKLKRKTQLSAHQAPRYDGTCRQLSKAEIESKQAQGFKAALRFKIPLDREIAFVDMVKGPQLFKSNDIGDFIIRRNDETASFMFCNAIDDALMEVTHALRGDDHLTNTPRQLMILEALGLTTPQYGHFPMILGQDGSPLSKRNGSRSVNELQREGYHPIALLNYLSGLGHHFETPKLRQINQLIEDFSTDRISLSPAHYDEVQLNFYQKETIHHALFEDFLEYIEPWCQRDWGSFEKSKFLKCIQPNIILPKELDFWVHNLLSEAEYSADAKAALSLTPESFFKEACGLLKEQVLDYKQFQAALKLRVAQKGRAFFMPLRAAWTHQIEGPELGPVLDLIGTDLAIRRLQKAQAYVTNL